MFKISPTRTDSNSLLKVVLLLTVRTLFTTRATTGRMRHIKQSCVVYTLALLNPQMKKLDRVELCNHGGHSIDSTKQVAGPWELSVFRQGTGMRSTRFFGNGCWQSGGDSQLLSINWGGREPGTDERWV
uniref:Secreted protein n=1 Tax=Romanomermis culicivorax TaxID=13658 RepID=A0A915HDG7_ROMCU